ncbi:MAG TPA: hypothetical protein PLF40_04370 [Kofleriaceae bacterium]|nr:hypothetical protein [Kofleriaceae bacterium]
MPRPRVADLEALLRALGAANMDYIVVGGAAAVILGAPTTTQELAIVPSIVPSQTPDNIARLSSVLTELDTDASCVQRRICLLGRGS